MEAEQGDQITHVWQATGQPHTQGANAVQYDRIVDDPTQDTVRPAGTPPTDDGRTMRRIRNREAVIVSLLDLIREGRLSPSVADIADRAGVSHRSLFRYFTDLNDLVRTAIEHEVARAVELAQIPEIGEGSLERRVDAFVDSRLRVFAETYEVGRVARFRSGEIPAVENALKEIAQLHRNQMREHFAPELSQLDDAIAEFTLDGLVVQTGFESYDTHRRLLEHSTECIRASWSHSLLNLLRS